jgi:hypothetical protein
MNLRVLALMLLVAVGFAMTPVAPASAQIAVEIGPHGVPIYREWQPAWDRFEFDRRHIIVGTVASFEPFRLQVARPNGTVQMIDLKNGTVILPTGATPMTNERVALVGYYSRGTFIANRVVIHP